MKAMIIVTAVLQLLCVVAFWVMWALGKQVGLLPIILSALFLITAIGLLFRKNWARVLTRLMGAILLIGIILMVIGAVIVAQGGFRISSDEWILLGAIVPAGVGLWWFWVFQASKSRDFFSPPVSVGNTMTNATRRPTSISIIAVLNCLGIFSLPWVYQIESFPFMGILFEGWSAKLVNGLWVLVYVPLGIGLWRLKEWARIGTLALLCLGFISHIISVLNGTFDRHMMIAMAQLNRVPAPNMEWFTAISLVIFSGIMVYFLITRRAAFRKINE